MKNIFLKIFWYKNTTKKKEIIFKKFLSGRGSVKKPSAKRFFSGENGTKLWHWSWTNTLISDAEESARGRAYNYAATAGRTLKIIVRRSINRKIINIALIGMKK